MDAQTYGTTTGIADSELGAAVNGSADLARDTGADTQAAEGRRDSGDLELRVASLEALFAAAGENGSGQFATAAQDAINGAGGTPHEDARFNLSEEERAAIEAEAAEAEGARRVALVQRAAQAFHASSEFTLRASAGITYGMYTPDALAASLKAAEDWGRHAADLLSAIGPEIYLPGGLASEEVLREDLARLRTTASNQLRALAWYADGHAEVLDKCPSNIAACLALGRSLSEAYSAANHSLTGIGLTIAALRAPRD